MPDSHALQVFYGTIPLILVLAAIFFREQTLLSDILGRLKALESGRVDIKERLVRLASRAGIVFSGD